jgi:hypothetical protein
VRRAALLLGPALAATLAAGCHDPITEVVLVVTSDMHVPTDVDLASFDSQPGGAAPSGANRFGGFGSSLVSFPSSVGFTSGGSTEVFSVSVQLEKSGSINGPQLVVPRIITNIAFTKGEITMLVVPFLAACACHGTSCPLPGTNPDCDDIDSPATVPFDPKVAPPSSPQLGPGQPVPTDFAAHEL